MATRRAARSLMQNLCRKSSPNSGRWVMAVGSRARLALAGGAQEGGFETCADVRSSQHTPTVEREVHLPRGRSATPARSRCGDNRSAAPAARRSPRARTGRPRGLVGWAETPVPLLYEKSKTGLRCQVKGRWLDHVGGARRQWSLLTTLIPYVHFGSLLTNPGLPQDAISTHSRRPAKLTDKFSNGI